MTEVLIIRRRRSCNIIFHEPSSTPNIFKSSSCIDIQIPRPYPKYSCALFSKHPYLCDEYKDMTLFEVNGVNMSVSNVCCACGGGTRDCEDYIGWQDSHSDIYTCKEYEKEDQCTVDGNRYFEYGHNANTACCVCGELNL